MNGSTIADTVYLSIKVGLLSTIINLPIAIFVAYFITRKEFKGKGILDGIINLPLVMPPVATGYILLIILGKNGVIGSALFSLTGFRIAFTQYAAIISSMVVSFPLITRNLRISLEMIDPKLENVSKSLGASSLKTMIKVVIPLMFPGIISGSIIGFARSLGEFGATITFAGNIEGVTRTLPLSVYTKLQVPGREKDAAILVSISVLISFIAMMSANMLGKKYGTKV